MHIYRSLGRLGACPESEDEQWGTAVTIGTCHAVMPHMLEKQMPLLGDPKMSFRSTAPQG